MSGLFKRPATPPPVPLPDEAAIAQRKRRATQQAQAASGTQATRLAPRPAQAGQEFTKQTLG